MAIDVEEESFMQGAERHVMILTLMQYLVFHFGGLDVDNRFFTTVGYYIGDGYLRCVYSLKEGRVQLSFFVSIFSLFFSSFFF